MKIVAFGDSFTWGSELADVVASNDILYSNHTWPALLAKKHDMQYMCFAKPGAGNQTIARTILSNIDKIATSDLVVINWTWIDRWDFYNLQDQDWVTVRPSSNATTIFDRYYFKYFQSELWNKLESLKSVTLVHSLLKAHSINFIATSIDDLLFDTRFHFPSYIKFLQNSIKDDITYFNNNGFYKWSKANKFEIGENGHPLEKAHHSAFNYIEENYDFDKYTKSNP